jgi:hypothetical protein
MTPRTMFRLRTLVPGLLLALSLPGACQPPGQTEIPPPPPVQVLEEGGYWSYNGGLELAITGNVVRVSITVDPAPFAQGGDLWAKGMPYLFLFSPGTRAALADHPGLGGVRVVVRHPGGDTMAEALLSRGTLNDFTWPRALNVAATARRDATERPARMRDLVEWGEEHTEFEYNSRYIGSN